MNFGLTLFDSLHCIENKTRSIEIYSIQRIEKHFEECSGYQNRQQLKIIKTNMKLIF